MKRLALAVLSVAGCICAVSCGNDSQTTSSSLNIDVQQYVVSSEATEEYTEPLESAYQLVPECGQNISSDIRLQEAVVNEYAYDITSCASLQEFLTECGLEHTPAANTYMETNGFLFDSAMFGFNYETNHDTDTDACAYEPDGTMTSVEVMQNGELVSSDNLDESKFDEYTIKGIHSSSFFTKSDYEVVFCNGVKVGMPEDELITAIGEGTLYDESVRFYNNGSAVMVVETETSLDSDTVVVDEITLLSLTDE